MVDSVLQRDQREASEDIQEGDEGRLTLLNQ